MNLDANGAEMWRYLDWYFVNLFFMAKLRLIQFLQATSPFHTMELHSFFFKPMQMPVDC